MTSLQLVDADYYRYPDGFLMEYFHITEQQLEEFTAHFIDRLSKYMQDALEHSQNAI